MNNKQYPEISQYCQYCKKLIDGNCEGNKVSCLAMEPTVAFKTKKH